MARSQQTAARSIDSKYSPGASIFNEALTGDSACDEPIPGESTPLLHQSTSRQKVTEFTGSSVDVGEIDECSQSPSIDWTLITGSARTRSGLTIPVLTQVKWCSQMTCSLYHNISIIRFGLQLCNCRDPLLYQSTNIDPTLPRATWLYRYPLRPKIPFQKLLLFTLFLDRARYRLASAFMRSA